MKSYKNLYSTLCSADNLREACIKAMWGKMDSPEIRAFDIHWQNNLSLLRHELQEKTYKPSPLRKFILRDPKTRTICVSDFRDRIVHHALVNTLLPVFEPRFIYDSFASRKGKGTFSALKRCDSFIRKVTQNNVSLYGGKGNAVVGFALKADIRHYFDTVDHAVLLRIIKKHIVDKDVLWLVQVILDNYNSGISGKGMPLGNWTSQFFANVYLNELDQFVKHKLRVKYYLRYVDDFVLFHRSKMHLQEYEKEIEHFLTFLKLELHPDKCKIIPLHRGISFLGFRIFPHYKILRKRNIRMLKQKLSSLLDEYGMRNISAYDILDVVTGWNGYAMMGNTHKLRQRLWDDVQKAISRK